MKTQKTFFLLFSALVFTLTACTQGAQDADKILDAQNCLDTATTTTAANCVQMVDGIESAGAYLIRCVGNFVVEGFNDPSKIATALDALKAGGNGANGSAAMIAAMAFTSKATEADNAAFAETTLGYCNKASSKGLIFLGGLAQTSTVLGSLSAGIDLSNPATITGANLQAAMGALAGNATAQAAVGSAIVSMYQSNCSGGQTATGNYCQQFQSAIGAVAGGASNPTGVGQQIMTCYNNPAAAGCSGF